ncbi:hypothetical protein EDB81DRAFT_796545 [Dactylonectria macrodidyma]|uniref:Uncharacterized protein n=1 Tax=Dactylonectria macrodidyma TaxID=307937 RepID=A0A9P9J5V9_9HYPO|nr:hypothetical protein EDB81DRAFT_796545 [Dactylonectria macrodidyma]
MSPNPMLIQSASSHIAPRYSSPRSRTHFGTWDMPATFDPGCSTTGLSRTSWSTSKSGRLPLFSPLDRNLNLNAYLGSNSCSLHVDFHCASRPVTTRHHLGSKRTRRGIIIQSSSVSLNRLQSTGASAWLTFPTNAYSNKFPAKERINQSTTHMSEIWQAPSLVFRKMPLSAILASAELSPPRSHAPSTIKSQGQHQLEEAFDMTVKHRSWADKIPGNVMSS